VINEKSQFAGSARYSEQLATLGAATEEEMVGLPIAASNQQRDGGETEEKGQDRQEIEESPAKDWEDAMSHEMEIVNKGVEQSSAGPLVPTPRMAFIALWRMRDNHALHWTGPACSVVVRSRLVGAGPASECPYVMRHEPLDYESRQSPGSQRCPFCGSQALVNGKLVGDNSMGGGSNIGFVPDGLKSFALTFTPADVVLRDGVVTVCRDCGAMWSRVDVVKLCQVLARWGKDGGR
jgi:hypothetical protein